MRAAGPTAAEIEALQKRVNLSSLDFLLHPLDTDSDASIKKQLKELSKNFPDNQLRQLINNVIPTPQQNDPKAERLLELAAEVDQENAHAAALKKLGVIPFCRDSDMLGDANQQRKSPEITQLLISVLKEPEADQATSVSIAVENKMREQHDAIRGLIRDTRNSKELQNAIQLWKDLLDQDPSTIDVDNPKDFYKAYQAELEKQKGGRDPKENPLMDPAKNPLLAYAIQMNMMADAAAKMDAKLTAKKDAALGNIDTTKLIAKLTEMRPVGDADIHPPAPDPQKPAQWVDTDRATLSKFIKAIEALNDALAALKTTLENTKNPESADLKAKEKAVADAHLAVAGMLHNTFTKQSLLKTIAEDDLNAVLENLARIRNAAQAALKLQLKNTPANTGEMNASANTNIEKFAKKFAGNDTDEVTVRILTRDNDGKKNYTVVLDENGAPIKFQKRDVRNAVAKIEAKIDALRRAGSNETMTIIAEKDGTHTFKFSNPEREKEFVQMLKDEYASRLAEENSKKAIVDNANPAVVASNAAGAPLAPTSDAVVEQQPGQNEPRNV